MANNHKLKVTVATNGYEVTVKDVTGFGPDGYNNDDLNQTKVKAILVVLSDSLGTEISKIRLEGQDKNDFMAGTLELSLETSTSDIKPLFKTEMYNVNSYLLTAESVVNGLANYSDVVGSGFELLVKDPFTVATDEVYQVMSVNNSGTILVLDRPLVKFTSKLEFGYQFKFRLPIYINSMNLLFQLGSLTSNTLQKDGEAHNFAALAGYLNTLTLMGPEDNSYRILRNAEVLTKYLRNKYFRS